MFINFEKNIINLVLNKNINKTNSIRKNDKIFDIYCDIEWIWLTDIKDQNINTLISWTSDFYKRISFNLYKFLNLKFIFSIS